MPGPSDRAYADAERRLGRALTDSERRIDIAGYDADLERGKRRLHAAIEAEKMRVVRARVAGKRARMRLTPEMVEALEWLRRRGVAHAHAELRAAGVEPSRAHAEPAGIRGLLRALRAALAGIGRRIDRELEIRARRKRIDVTMTGVVRAALLRAMERKVPGSLAAAADLVSSAMARGLEEGFSLDADLFQWWEFSSVMDGSTCGECRKMDGTRYPSWEAIMVVLPNGGPYPLCMGNGRCRCRPVPGKLRLE